MTVLENAKDGLSGKTVFSAAKERSERTSLQKALQKEKNSIVLQMYTAVRLGATAQSFADNAESLSSKPDI